MTLTYFSFSPGTLLGRRSGWEFEPLPRANFIILILFPGGGTCMCEVDSDPYLRLDTRLCTILGNVGS